MTSFSVDLAKFGQKAVDNAEKIVRKIAFDMHSRIVMRMPVDTGRAKANTQISINNLPSGSTLDTDKNGRASISAGGRTMKQFELGDVIFIYNNVEYIVRLNEGHSQQAPKRFVERAVDKVARGLK